MNRISLLSLIIGFGLWQTASGLQWIDPVYFPGPASILARAAELILFDFEFRENVFQSLKRLLLGEAIAFPLALLLAMSSALKAEFRSLISPWIGLIYPVPKLAFFPFLLIAMGTGDLSKVSMIAMGSFFLMYLSFQLGFKRIFESEYFEIVRIYKISKFKVFWQVFIRGASPEIFNGIKIGFGYGLVMMVGSEMTMSKNGLGFYMWNSWDQFKLLDMYSSLLWISLMGICSFQICDLLENRLKKIQRIDLTLNL